MTQRYTLLVITPSMDKVKSQTKQDNSAVHKRAQIIDRAPYLMGLNKIVQK